MSELWCLVFFSLPFFFFLFMPFLFVCFTKEFSSSVENLVAACSVLPLSRVSLIQAVIVAAQRPEPPAGLLPVLRDGPVLVQKLRLWFWLPPEGRRWKPASCHSFVLKVCVAGSSLGSV